MCVITSVYRRYRSPMSRIYRLPRSVHNRPLYRRRIRTNNQSTNRQTPNTCGGGSSQKTSRDLAPAKQNTNKRAQCALWRKKQNVRFVSVILSQNPTRWYNRSHFNIARLCRYGLGLVHFDDVQWIVDHHTT